MVFDQNISVMKKSEEFNSELLSDRRGVLANGGLTKLETLMIGQPISTWVVLFYALSQHVLVCALEIVQKMFYTFYRLSRLTKRQIIRKGKAQS